MSPVCLNCVPFRCSIYRGSMVASAQFVASVLILLGSGLTPALFAADPPIVRSLTVRPRAAPAAALEFRLAIPAPEQRAGNAAVFYGRAALLNANDPQAKDVDAWLALPPPELPLATVNTYLETQANRYEELLLAAYCRDCDWGVAPEQRKNLFAILLPEVQAIRGLARMLSLRARAQILEGKYRAAIETMETGLAMARHTSAGPTLIHGLVGISVTMMMIGELELLIEQPAAPNMYWALACLARPLHDHMHAMEVEMMSIATIVPNWQQLASPDLPDEAYEAALQGLVRDLNAVAPNDLNPWLLMKTLATGGYQRAREGLIQNGFTADAVGQMPPMKVVMMYTVRNFNIQRDAFLKWTLLPMDEALPRIDRELDRFMTVVKESEVVPLLQLTVPAVNTVLAKYADTERRLALLRTVEALRDYAANHDGQWPPVLDAIDAMGVPRDIITGQPFVYRRDGKQAILETPTPEPKNVRLRVVRYELTLATEQKAAPGK